MIRDGTYPTLSRDSAIDLDGIYHNVTKKSRLGAPEKLNYAAMVISVCIRYVEGIPTSKQLIKRLKDDLNFKLNCGFLVSDNTPHVKLPTRDF